MNRTLAVVGALLLVAAALFGWHAWTWNQILQRTADLEDRAEWSHYQEAMECDFFDLWDDGETLEEWVFWYGLEANRDLVYHLRYGVQRLNAVALMPWQGATRSAVETITKHYDEWLDYLKVEYALISDAIGFEITDYDDYLDQRLDAGMEIDSTFMAAPSAFYDAVPFWVSEQELDDILRGGQMGGPVSCLGGPEPDDSRTRR